MSTELQKARQIRTREVKESRLLQSFGIITDSAFIEGLPPGGYRIGLTNSAWHWWQVGYWFCETIKHLVQARKSDSCTIEVHYLGCKMFCGIFYIVVAGRCFFVKIPDALGVPGQMRLLMKWPSPCESC